MELLHHRVAAAGNPPDEAGHGLRVEAGPGVPLALGERVPPHAAFGQLQVEDAGVERVAARRFLPGAHDEAPGLFPLLRGAVPVAARAAAVVALRPEEAVGV